MSFVTTIDTLQFSNRMQKADLDKKVSDELAEVIKDSQGQSLENVATKYDLQLLELATKRDLHNLEKATKHDLQILKHEIIIKLGSFTGSMIALSVAILATLIKL